MPIELTPTAAQAQALVDWLNAAPTQTALASLLAALPAGNPLVASRAYVLAHDKKVYPHLTCRVLTGGSTTKLATRRQMSRDYELAIALVKVVSPAGVAAELDPLVALGEGLAELLIDVELVDDSVSAAEFMLDQDRIREGLFLGYLMVEVGPDDD
jgi:hypothetical protein